MTLKSNAVSGELSSPFYIRNKEFCEEYEQYITNLGGKIYGSFNAWSYNVLGVISGDSKWGFRIKKSTFTSSGNLFLTSKSQSLFLASQWFSKDLASGCPKFTIRRKQRWDYIRIALFDNWKKLDNFDNYVIKCYETENFFISKINKILSNLYTDKKVFNIHYNDPEIYIDLRTDKIHRKEMENLIRL